MNSSKIYEKVLATFLSLLMSSCAKDSWDGEYSCNLPLGRVAGGIYVSLDTNLTIKGNECDVTMIGYQMDESLLCTYKTSPNRLSIYFKSYPDGTQKNAYGYQIHKPEELLFELIKKDDVLHTQWEGLYSHDPKLMKDPCFQRQ